jgi:hypothetical protein
MMVVCEHTCGFCSTEKCFDSAPDCPSLRSLCFERPISPLFRQQCPLTCGLCQPVERDEGKEEEEMNNQKAPKELIVLVRKKNGIKCEDLSTSCTENAKLCNDEVSGWMGLLKLGKVNLELFAITRGKMCKNMRTLPKGGRGGNCNKKNSTWKKERKANYGEANGNNE